ncbi:MAG TPA: molybdate ABC transporter substrate-binding protein [Thermomicrobiales bacterium]|nr:molybdate ABC transporter substrate-binding protein [Thermomicrobiales bacterium]
MPRASLVASVRRMIVICLVVLLALPGLMVDSTVAAQITCEDVSAPAASPATPEAASPAAGIVVPFPEDGGTVDVFAAASLVDAFAEIESDLEAANPNLDVVVVTAGSQALVTQLMEGAEADVLATANTRTMDDAVAGGLIDGESATFTGNRLVIVAPSDNPAGIASLDDLAGDDLNLVLAGADVPVGTYSRNVLCAYDASGTAPDGFIKAVDANVVSEEEDVRTVLAKVQLGEADAGIVYASDAVASELAGTPLTVIEFPAGLDATAEYPIAAVAGGDIDLAQAFISYVLSADGQATLEAYGFAQP